MFKSTNEYDNAINRILINIRETSTYGDFSEYNYKDFEDVIRICVSKGYISGVELEENALGEYHIQGNPRITYSGLKFIENFKQ